jgi:hypothetical protein
LADGRNDADALANILINLRVEPNKQCRQFKGFSSILAVMSHEITHLSIGLEDIHPPAFYDFLGGTKQEYKNNN